MDASSAKVQPAGTFMARVDELAILRMCFLHNSVDGMPVLAILHEDYRTAVRRCDSATPELFRAASKPYVFAQMSLTHVYTLDLSNCMMHLCLQPVRLCTVTTGALFCAA